MTSQIQPYDVVQVDTADGWKDFCTIRTQDDIAAAQSLVQHAQWEGTPKSFRVVRKSGAMHIILARD